jgi:hypothetical protein
MNINEIREYLKSIPFDESKFGLKSRHEREGRDFHIRFEMSGYNFDELNASEINTNILLLFAKFGIYDYSDFLYLDFYKGTGTLYYKIKWNHDLIEVDYDGYTTCEIIEDIFKRTVYSGRYPRRR